MPPLLYIILQRKKRVGQLCLKHIGVPPDVHTRAQNSYIFVTLLFLCFTVCGQRKHLQNTKQMTMIKKPTMAKIKEAQENTQRKNHSSKHLQRKNWNTKIKEPSRNI
jgi:hypothetical protein